MNPIDDRAVGVVVRRYADASVTPDPWSSLGRRALMKGVSRLITNPTSANPDMTVLTPDRSLWDHEYRFVANTPFTPALSNILPVSAVRLGETWTLSPAAAVILLGDPVETGTIQGKLSEIRPLAEPAADGSTEIAVLDLEGRLRTVWRDQRSNPRRIPIPNDPTSIQPRNPSHTRSGPHRRGCHHRTSTRPGDHGTNHRQRPARFRAAPRVGPPATLAVNEGEPLAIPNPPPLRHPKTPGSCTPIPKVGFTSATHRASASTPARTGARGDQVTLVQFRRETPDLLVISYREGVQPKPEEAFQGAIERYRAAGFEVLPLDPKATPADDWPGMAVHRIEAALTPPPAPSVPRAPTSTATSCFPASPARFRQWHSPTPPTRSRRSAPWPRPSFTRSG